MRNVSDFPRRDPDRGQRVQLIEHLRKTRGVSLAIVRELEMRALAHEQARAKVVLELGHVAADRAMGDEELARCGRHALVARRGLEGAQRIERGQASGHTFRRGRIECEKY